MTHRTLELFRRIPGSRSTSRLGLVALIALGLGCPDAWAQDAAGPGVQIGPRSAKSGPIAEAMTRLTQVPAAPVRRSTPKWNDPILLGTVIGASGTALWQAQSCRGDSCNLGTAALVGAGVGAYTGLVVSAVRSARAGRPVGRGVKIGLAAGAVAAVAAGGLACYGAGGCGGVS